MLYTRPMMTHICLPDIVQAAYSDAESVGPACRRWHPDRNPEKKVYAEKKFKEVRLAACLTTRDLDSPGVPQSRVPKH